MLFSSLQVPCLFLAVSTRTRLPVSTPQPVNAGRRGAPHLRVHLLTCSSLLVVDLFGMTHSHFIFSLLSPSPPPSSDLAEEACEEEIWALWDVFWRWCQQWCLKCLLWALVWFQERRHSPLPATDWGRGRSSQPLRQLKLVREERRASGPAELTEEPENTEVRWWRIRAMGGVLTFVEPLRSSSTKGAEGTET